ncbi:hydantoinase B/oxoprolinase family protein [Methylocella sp. CPCC 101449]|jgi:N-methylhydantoinase B|uniref:hydantoinase B/oxoprolinase family protein n=1 Tax=Methylocella sp. CPCC 101449 TaxID=2987531 RepID=UPI00288DEAEC|nr:hydantoinase B/oxoprolinase family protein [Methylocella sp. CPCC 101449]MDT2022256.1 hydantoinase B/oxoprolinase family protein [Methylocella sp. CPCC 101449]HEV2573018.1 hydantoinase B/oxoprolinase family protein [Beijerinckiaceae bacterium]
MDPVELEILWSNLIGIVTERSKALQRIAFSPIVREAGDLACALFDRRGRMVAQANTGTPGHINSLAFAGAHLVKLFDGKCEPGDVLITNDPWLSAGHFFDITLLTPIYDGDKILAYIGSTIHHTDIGGYGIGAGARDVHEEGLWIPPLKFYERGVPNAVLHAMIGRNVRTPDAVFGDLAAQVSSGHAAADHLIALCRRHGLEDIETLSDEIIARSEEATRAAIRKLKPGVYHGESQFDVPGGEIITLKTALTVDTDKGSITVDFDGSSMQTSTGINVVLNYTHAYSTFAIRSCLNPELPNNTGSLAPIEIKAPEGSIVNCRYPAPVNARHVVGMYVPMPILKALYQVMPERVLAEGSGAVWTMQIQGKKADGNAFTSSMFNYSGGMGARATKPGPSATCYPTGVAAVPIEILEAAMPIVFDRKELRRGSGGQGRTAGGDGQIIQFHMLTQDPWLLNAVPSRLGHGPDGIGGGTAGQKGVFQVNGRDVSEPRKLTMQPNDVVLLETPGGGGFGSSNY